MNMKLDIFVSQGTGEVVSWSDLLQTTWQPPRVLGVMHNIDSRRGFGGHKSGPAWQMNHPQSIMFQKHYMYCVFCTI